jgi:hypothetical protein
MNSLLSPGWLTTGTRKTDLRYDLIPVERALVFQVLDQSPEVTNFLRKVGSFQASNGLRIATADFPEFKDSENTIFLRGSDKAKDGKVDTTRFVTNIIRDKKAVMVHQALKELVDTVKSLQSYYAPVPANINIVDLLLGRRSGYTTSEQNQTIISL